MVQLIVSSVLKLKLWTFKHKRLAAEAILSVLLALSICCGIILNNNNKKLSESLEIALNNIEAYLDIVSNSLLANNVLKLDVLDLKNSNDVLILKLDSVCKDNKIKRLDLNSAATQTQSIVVNSSKGVRGDLTVILKDTTYTDSIKYNDLTNIYYTIGKDTINVRLDVLNTQYLYTYKTKEYKNKKSFLKRLFTLDFKKVNKYKYKIINTNDLIKESDVRIIEIQ